MDHAANRDTSCYDERVPSSQERPMARVRFDPTVTIHPSSPFLLSPLECHHLWYRTRDFSVFSRQNRELVEEYRRLAEAGGQDLSLLHARGLEVKLAKGNTNEVLFRHELVTRMVLQEQAKQRFEGVTNPSLLRAVSLSVSRRANYLAYKLGKQDALDATATFYGGPRYQSDQLENKDKFEAARTVDAKSLVDHPIKIVETNMIGRAAVGVSPKSTMDAIDRDARMIILGCVLPRPVLT